ncbi:hypothetical protein DICVIV_02822 [Dictyocaulus viviparus]|uniref:Uncharacterized protein n=1 Tax=Dictyocaulus viviparus TaxID=29172 RepID=A0A0D8Y4N5_DICVI|nr:hypothetical protein DICVIV_02822 [Dictyocaulus viviparus]
MSGCRECFHGDVNEVLGINQKHFHLHDFYCPTIHICYDSIFINLVVIIVKLSANMFTLRILCAIQLASIVTTEWEIPINISHYVLEVIAGYPTFIEYYYPAMNNQTVNDYPSHLPVLPISYKKLLNWTCNVFPGDDHTCVSTITAEKCRNGTQFSASYWGSTGSCEKEGQFVSCVNVTLINNTCRDVVIRIYNGSKVHLVLRDVHLPSSLTQSFIEHYSAKNKPMCYYTALPVIANQPLYVLGPGKNGNCGSKSNLVKYGLNTTVECSVERSVWSESHECPPMDKLKGFYISNVSHICNCGLCEVPLLLHPSPVIHYNSTSCVIPHRATLSFTHINGFINGAYLSYDYRTISDVENRIRISFRSQFIQYFEPCQKSRFELQRSRFYCPSDVTCLQELWFPLDDLPTSIISVIGCITVVVLVTIITMKQNHLTYFNCDCGSVLSKAKL